MLQSHKKPVPERTMSAIIESLAERVYAHGHAIGLTEAKGIGLPVVVADDALDGLMWQLLEQHEGDLKLLEPLDPAQAVAATGFYSEDGAIAVIESRWAAHSFQGQIEIRAQRQQPPQLNVALNLNVQLPAGLDPVASAIQSPSDSAQRQA
jgi:hypothetical protein